MSEAESDRDKAIEAVRRLRAALGDLVAVWESSSTGLDEFAVVDTAERALAETAHYGDAP